MALAFFVVFAPNPAKHRQLWPFFAIISRDAINSCADYRQPDLEPNISISLDTIKTGQIMTVWRLDLLISIPKARLKGFRNFGSDIGYTHFNPESTIKVTQPA